MRNGHNKPDELLVVQRRQCKLALAARTAEDHTMVLVADNDTQQRHSQTKLMHVVSTAVLQSYPDSTKAENHHETFE